MKPVHYHPYQRAIGYLFLSLSIPLLYLVSRPNAIVPLLPTILQLLRSVIELLTVVVAMLIFVTGYHAVLSSRKSAVALLGVGFLGAGLLDLLHMMSNENMAPFSSLNASETPHFFWLASGILAALAMAAYAAIPAIADVTSFKKRLALATMLAIVGSLGYIGFLQAKIVTLINFQLGGSIPLGIGLEGLIVVINLLTLEILWHRKRRLARECLFALRLSAALSVASGLFFCGFGGFSGGGEVLGILYKAAAYLFLFHATFNESLRRPIQRMAMQFEREKIALSVTPDGVLWVDSNGTILLANPAMETLSGYTVTELVGKNVDLFLPEHLRPQHSDSVRTYFTTPKSRAMGKLDLKLMRRDGTMQSVDISLGHWKDDETSCSIAFIRDLTERKKFVDSLKHQATHDELTGLPNRSLFHLQLSQALTRAQRSRLKVAVLFLDLDYFKTVNDSMGHAAGDALLVQVGVRLRGLLRANDMLARLGGDEFGILLADLSTSDEALVVANKILESLQSAYRLFDQDVYSGGSLGVALYPDDADDSDTLLRYADMAMYQAKSAGRGGQAFYSNEMDAQVHYDMRLHVKLKEAITNKRLSLYYQPQVDVQSGRIVGAEALLRWDDPVLGTISPEKFIPIAESTGLILPLSDWVLESVCEQIAMWAKLGQPVRVAVNFSPHQFGQPNLPQKVQILLEKYGVSGRWLDIEITETVAMIHPQQAREHINSLVALGCSVALDDFGTGYSSLVYLKALPVSKLKIDRSFMAGIPDDANDVSICKAIIGLGHSLGLRLVAEGVENTSQLHFLRQFGCQEYQGWLFAKAMCAENFLQLMLDERQRPAVPLYRSGILGDSVVQVKPTWPTR